MVYLLSLMLGWTCMGIQNYVAAAQANNNFARTLQAVQAGSPNYSDITRAGAMANLENELLARKLEGDMVVNATNAHAEVSAGKARAAIEEGKVLREQERQKMAGKIAAQARRDRLRAMRPEEPETYIPKSVVMPVDITDELRALKAKGASDSYTPDNTEPVPSAPSGPSARVLEMFNTLTPKSQEMIRRLKPDYFPNDDTQGSSLKPQSFVGNTNSGALLPAITLDQAKQYAIQAGATPEEARTLAAIGVAESRLIPNNDTIKSGLYKRNGETSYGVWQINMTGEKMRNERLKQFGINSVEDLYDPLTNAKAAVTLMRNRGGFGDWTTYNAGEHLPYMH